MGAVARQRISFMQPREIAWLCGPRITRLWSMACAQSKKDHLTKKLTVMKHFRINFIPKDSRAVIDDDVNFFIRKIRIESAASLSRIGSMLSYKALTKSSTLTQKSTAENDLSLKQKSATFCPRLHDATVNKMLMYRAWIKHNELLRLGKL